MDNDVFIDEYVSTLYTHWDWNLIPPHMHGAVKSWVEYGIKPTSFLENMCAHKVYDAYFHADDENKAKLSDWISFIVWHLPSGCHGSREKILLWSQLGGLRGIMNKKDQLTETTTSG